MKSNEQENLEVKCQEKEARIRNASQRKKHSTRIKTDQAISKADKRRTSEINNDCNCKNLAKDPV